MKHTARSHVVSLVAAGTLVLGSGIAVANGGLPEDPQLAEAPVVTTVPGPVEEVLTPSSDGPAADATAAATGTDGSSTGDPSGGDELPPVPEVPAEAPPTATVGEGAERADEVEDGDEGAETTDEADGGVERRTKGAGADGGVERRHGEAEARGERRVNHGSCVSAVARTAARGKGGVHGAAVSAVARSSAGKDGAGCDVGGAVAGPEGASRPSASAGPPAHATARGHEKRADGAGSAVDPARRGGGKGPKR